MINLITKQPLAQQQTSVEQEVGSWAFYRTLIDTT